MGFGGSTSAGSQSQQFQWPDWMMPGAQQYYNTAMGLSQTPYQQSGIPTNAPYNDYQMTAGQLAYDQAINGDPSTNAGRAALTGIASGNQSNPWQAFMANTAAGNSINPFMKGLQNFGGTNPFMSGMQGMAAGEANPYTIDPEKLIAANTADMTKAAKEGVMAQTDSAANMAGAYGGSAYQNMQAQNDKNLASAVGSMAANTRLQADQANANIWQQGQQNRLAAMGLGNQAFLGGQGNQLQAMLGGGNLFDAGIGRQLQAGLYGGQMFNNDIGNMLNAAQIAPSYANMDMNAFNNLNMYGNQMAGYQQGMLNSANGSFQQQMMYPWMMNEMLGGALSRLGSGNGSSTSSMMQPGYSPWMNLAGLGMMGYGMMP